MALRDQPYLPLYIQDIMTCEKLNECGAATHGIYIKGIMCLMHKSETYGEILLKQKDKQTDQQIKNFAIKISKHTPYEVPEIEAAITELVREKVCFIKEDILYQPRMVKDNATSEARKKAGKKGVFAKAKKAAKPKNLVNQNPKQITEYENENEYENEIDNADESELKGKNKKPKIEVVLPFDTDSFRTAWQGWKDYQRTQHRFSFKSPMTEQISLKHLSEMAGTEDQAIKIIQQSMANGWKGLFELKIVNGKSKSNGSADVSDEWLAETERMVRGN